jgi:hypothetical protein
MIDLGQIPGTTTTDNAGLVVARRRITELEIDVGKKVVAAGERSGRRWQQLLLTRYLYVRTQSTS